MLISLCLVVIRNTWSVCSNGEVGATEVEKYLKMSHLPLFLKSCVNYIHCKIFDMTVSCFFNGGFVFFSVTKKKKKKHFIDIFTKNATQRSF